MIQYLRRHTTGFFAKLLLCLLAGSFVLWGAEGLRMAGQQGGDALATVGDAKVTTADLAQDRFLLKQRLRQSFGENIPAGLERMALDQALQSRLNGLLYQQAGDAWRLPVSAETLKREIATTPAFRSESGQFDRLAYQRVLADIGMTEEQYADNIRVSLVRNYVQQMVRDAAYVPLPLAENLYYYQYEKRRLSFLDVPLKTVSPDEFSKKERAAYYEKNKTRYQTEEVRRVGWVRWNPKEEAAKATISSDEIKTFYNKHKSRYRTEEKRTLQQLVLDSREDADKAAALAKTVKFDAIPGKMDNKGSLVDLGAVEAATLPKELATVVFAREAKAGTVLPPVESPLGWHVIRIEKITPASEKTVAEVEKEIREELASQQRYQAVYDQIGRLEDAVAGGSSLEEAAKGEGVQLETSEALPASTSPDKAHEEQLFRRDAKTMEALFALDSAGAWVPAAEIGDEVILAGVTSITPPQPRPFSVAEGDVVVDMVKEQQESRTRRALKDMAEALQSRKKTMADVAKDVGKDVRTSEDTARKDSEKALNTMGVPVQTFARLLQGKKGETAFALLPDKGLLVQVDSVARAEKPSAKTLADIQAEAANVTAEALLEQFERGLRLKFPVKIDQTAFRSFSDDAGNDGL